MRNVKESEPAAQFMRRARRLSKIQPRGEGGYWIDHQELTASDVERTRDARHLTLWNVRLPPASYEAMPALEFLDLRGGRMPDLEQIAGAQQLRGLVVNQVRGLTDLDAIAGLVGLEILSLYGLAHVARLPDFARLVNLRRIEIGQMRSLTDLSSLVGAPALEELLLVKNVPIDADAVRPFLGHPTLKAFNWFWEDVPWSRAGPVLEALNRLEKPALLRPGEWLAKYGRNDRQVSTPVERAEGAARQGFGCATEARKSRMSSACSNVRQQGRFDHADGSRMTVNRTLTREADRELRRQSSRMAEELRTLRMRAGVSQAAVAREIGVTRSVISKLELGYPGTTLRTRFRVATLLGADLRINVYAGSGPVIRDAVQAAIIERLLTHADHAWRRTPEASVPGAGRRSVDLRLDGPNAIVLIEVESHLGSLEEIIREVHSKRQALAEADRGGAQRPIHVVLCLPKTRHHLAILRAHPRTIAAAFPASPADLLAALGECSGPWPGDGLLLVDVPRPVPTKRQTQDRATLGRPTGSISSAKEMPSGRRLLVTDAPSAWDRFR